MRPDSLAGYLAGLGLARICATQVRSEITCAWREEGFTLFGIDVSELLQFFADAYVPSPVVSPWAGGSGFSAGEDRSALEAIRSSESPRLSRYRNVIEQVLRFPELPPTGMTVGEVLRWADDKIAAHGRDSKLGKELLELIVQTNQQLAVGTITTRTAVADQKQGEPAAKLFTRFKSERRQASKAGIAARCRNELPDSCVAWLDASLILSLGDDGGIAQVAAPLSKDAVKPRLEYSRLFMESVGRALLGDQTASHALLRSFLEGTIVSGLIRSPAGMFSLASAGGANMRPDQRDQELPNNPWSFILLIEGSLSWASSLSSSQKGLASGSAVVASPFTVRHIAAGFGSAGAGDERVGKSSAEVWTPIWERPSSLNELERLISEGRVEVARAGGTRGRARNALDFAEAVGSLGVDRGISSFVRFAVVERRSQSFVAVPVGRLQVQQRDEIDLLRELDVQLELLDARFLRRFKGKEGPPALLTSLRRNINDAHYEVATRGGYDKLVQLVRALGALERVLAKRDPSKAPSLPRPLGGLSPEWVTACGDSTEVRLAAALAGLAATGAAGPFRSYVAPVDPRQDWKYLATSRAEAWFGASLPKRLASVLARRLLDAARGSGKDSSRNPTWGPWQVTLDDVGDFLEPGAIDEAALDDLIYGFTWVRHRDAEGTWRRPRHPSPPVPREYSLLKLLFLPSGLRRGADHLTLSPPSELVPLLLAGRVDDAVAVGTRVLAARGLRPRRLLRRGVVDAEFGARLAAALLIPMFQVDRLAADALLPNADATSKEMNDAV